MSDFVIIGNRWNAIRDNPTSKHQVAVTLARQGHRVLWVDGGGIRYPKLASSGDRAKIASRVLASWRPAKIVSSNLWQIAPLIIPAPGNPAVRSINETIYRRAIRRAVRRQGFESPVLINFLPTIPGVMRAWSREQRAEGGGYGAEERGQGTEIRDQRTEVGGQRIADRSASGGIPACAPRRVDPPLHHRRTSAAENRHDPGIISGFRSQVSGFDAAPPRCVYYCVDRWDQFGTYDSGLMEMLDAECCRNADMVITSAQDLFERCKRHNENTHLMPHGVDWGHFRPKWSEMKAEAGNLRPEVEKRVGEGGAGGACETIDYRPQTIDHRQGEEEGQISNQQPATSNLTTSPNDQTTQQPDNLATAAAAHRIGFFGLISEWVDQELLLKLAKIENCEVMLAGKADVSAEDLQKEENIKMIGSVPYDELPELVGTFDVGIIPFKVNELTRAVNPIKLREMLAAGCPVVSTDLPEVRKMAAELPEGALSIAEDADEFVRLAREALARQLSMDERKRISESVRDQDWAAKVDELIELIR